MCINLTLLFITFFVCAYIICKAYFNSQTFNFLLFQHFYDTAVSYELKLSLWSDPISLGVPTST